MSDCPQCKERNDQYGLVLHALCVVHRNIAVLAACILLLLVVVLAGCAPAPSEAHPSRSAFETRCRWDGEAWDCNPRKPRDTYCFRLAETCEWPKGGPPADPICDELCVRGVYKAKAPKK